MNVCILQNWFDSSSVVDVSFKLYMNQADNK